MEALETNVHPNDMQFRANADHGRTVLRTRSVTERWRARLALITAYPNA